MKEKQRSLEKVRRSKHSQTNELHVKRSSRFLPLLLGIVVNQFSGALSEGDYSCLTLSDYQIEYHSQGHLSEVQNAFTATVCLQGCVWLCLFIEPVSAVRGQRLAFITRSPAAAT